MPHESQKMVSRRAHRSPTAGAGWRAALLGLAVAAAGLSAAQAQDAAANKAARPTRTVLGTASPKHTPGWELSVRRVTFAPGVAIPGEIHPGPQIVTIISGELTLRVLGGEAQARRVLPDGTQGPVETFGPSDRDLVFRAGDTVTEPESLILAPRNAGKEPLVILASSLLPTGMPHAIYIEGNVRVD